MGDLPEISSVLSNIKFTEFYHNYNDNAKLSLRSAQFNFLFYEYFGEKLESRGKNIREKSQKNSAQKFGSINHSLN